MCKLPLEFFLDIYRERERKREKVEKWGRKDGKGSCI